MEQLERGAAPAASKDKGKDKEKLRETEELLRKLEGKITVLEGVSSSSRSRCCFADLSPPSDRNETIYRAW